MRVQPPGMAGFVDEHQGAAGAVVGTRTFDHHPAAFVLLLHDDGFWSVPGVSGLKPRSLLTIDCAIPVVAIA